MKPALLRKWIRKYGNLGVLMAAGYLGLHFLWTKRRLHVIMLLFAISIGSLILWPHPHPVSLSVRIETLPAAIPPAPVAPKPAPEWQPRSLQAREKLEEAERKLARYVDVPPMNNDVYDHLLTEAEEAAQASCDEEVSGRAYAELGEVRMRSYRYEDAVRQFTLALEIAPDAAIAQQGRARAQHIQNLSDSVKKHLSSKQHIQKLFPFEMPGRKLWAMLTCEEREDGGFPERENARLSVYTEKDQKLMPIWHSQVIPSVENRGYPHPDLWAFRMTGQKIPELVFLGVCSGGSANPTLLHVYRWNGRAFRNVLEAYSGEQPIWIEDLRHTGRYQVRSVVYIGSSQGHSDTNHVRWPDVYDWNGSRFVEANVKYPEAFRKYRNEILEILQRYPKDTEFLFSEENHPKDPELLKYLGLTYLYEHRKRMAFATFEKMERASHKALQEDPSDRDSQIYHWRDLGDVLEMEGKRQEAIRCYRRVERLCREGIKEYPDDDVTAYRYHEQKAAKQIRHLQSGGF